MKSLVVLPIRVVVSFCDPSLSRVSTTGSECLQLGGARVNHRIYYSASIYTIHHTYCLGALVPPSNRMI